MMLDQRRNLRRFAVLYMAQRLPLFAPLALELLASDLAADQAGETKHSIVGHAESVFGRSHLIGRAETLDPDLVPPRCLHSQKSTPGIGANDETAARRW